jgi:Uma2 family endonuclease
MSRQDVGAPEPRPHYWTREEYYRLADLGWFRGRRVQRIQGEIVEMSPQKGPHATAVGCVAEALRSIFGSSAVVREEKPLELGADSDPEPDVAVVRGALRDYVAHHPRTALLVVEVADTSLSFDLGDKASLYAGAGIEDYWVLDLAHRKLVVHRSPMPSFAEPPHHAYRDVTTLSPDDTVSPLAAPSATIKVSDLLP